MALANGFSFDFMVAVLECSVILIIANCLNFCMTSYNSVTYFLFFMHYPEKVKKPHCFHNILEFWATPKS